MPGRGGVRWWLSVAAAVVLLGPALGEGSAAAAGRCGNHPWCDTRLSSDQRAGLLLAQLTQDDKITLLTGGAVPRLDVPGEQWTDGGVGAGGVGAGREGATAMPAGTALAAGFDTADANAYGTLVGNEVRNRGFDGVFGPNVNIMRTPLGGRTFESYGEDPYLASRMGVGWIEGAQSQGVMGDVKHYAANNQEGQAGVGPLEGAVGGRFNVNAVVDQRTLHEIYFRAFEAAVTEAHVATVMCSYNEVNGDYACENPYLLQQVLRHEWGFGGFVVSDAGAAHNVVRNMENGLDYDILYTAYNYPEVKAALASGQVSEALLDQHARNILRTLFAYGFFDRPAFKDDTSKIDQQGHARVAQHVEEQGITLLKNNGVLPLDASKLRSIAVIGSPANSYVRGGGSSEVSPFFFVTPRDGIARRAGPHVKVSYDDGSDPATAAATASSSDVAVVFVRDADTEGADRACMSLDCPNVETPTSQNLQYTPPGQDELIQQVAAANPRTIVVLETGGPVLTPWRGQVKGLLEAWYPGEEGGNAIARVLFGDVAPGGRLPATFPQQEGDIPTAGDPEKYPGVGYDEHYKEGVLAGYRWYGARGIQPAFPFGFGLSYTSFAYSGLRVRPAAGGGAVVRFLVTNTGRRFGTDVPQLYLGIPSPAPGIVQPPRQLKGFRKIGLAPGRSAVVSLGVDSGALAYWSEAARGWRVAPGCYGVMVGHSSRDISLRATLPVGGARCGGASRPSQHRRRHRHRHRRGHR